MTKLQPTLRLVDLRAVVRPSSTSGKFLLVSYEEQYFLVTAPIEDFPYHAHILAYFCDERGIRVKYNQNRDMATVEGQAPPVQTHGGGWWERQADDSLVFYGQSQAYGAFDESLLVGLGESLPVAWKLAEPSYSS